MNMNLRKNVVKFAFCLFGIIFVKKIFAKNKIINRIMTNHKQLQNISDYIPSDIWGCIIMYLDIDDLFQTRKLSMSIRKIIYDRCPKKIVNINHEEEFRMYNNLSKNILFNVNIVNFCGHSEPINKRIVTLNHSHLITGDLKKFPKLTELHLSHIPFNILSGFKFIKHLKILHLNETKINPNELKYLNNLTHLFLNHNKCVTNKDLNELTTLKFLSLNNNKNITDDGIKDLVNLEELHIKKCYGISNNILLKLKNLKVLRVSTYWISFYPHGCDFLKELKKRKIKIIL